MLKVNLRTLKENVSLSKAGFILYSPISILAFPVTVLVINPGAFFLLLLGTGFLLTVAMFLIYLPFTWIDQRIDQASSLAKSLNFLTAAITVGAIRGYLFFLIVDGLNLKAPGDLLNRVFASTATTLFWLSASNILINFSRTFRSRYQRSLNIFIKQNIGTISSLVPSLRSTTEVESLQIELTKSLSSKLQDGDAENLREVADLLKSKINLQLRPLSRRIWLRSLNEYPVIRFPQMLKDSIRFLDYSKQAFVGIMLILALLDNVFIRSLSESIVRTATFFAIVLLVLYFRRTRLLQHNSLFLIVIGLVPVAGSEYISDVLGFTGSWTATLLISLVAPAVIIVLSLFNLTLRDHALIIELLENYEITRMPGSPKSFDPGERQLASYLHNSLQSELLAIAGQLEEAATSNNHEKSSDILQKVSSLINRSFIDDFEKFSESPLERLDVVRKSWAGILNISIEIPTDLLDSPERNAKLVQTIEEFAANSYRHGKASEIKVIAHRNEVGLQLTLRSNGSQRISTKRGLGSEWLDQIALQPWKLESTKGITSLEITI
ncbi:hypothetical protein MCEMRE26_00467 [Candidatus Nanopelagicaceae bacterium]